MDKTVEFSIYIQITMVHKLIFLSLLVVVFENIAFGQSIKSVIYLGKIFTGKAGSKVATEIGGAEASMLLNKLGKAEYLDRGYNLYQLNREGYLIHAEDLTFKNESDSPKQYHHAAELEASAIAREAQLELHRVTLDIEVRRKAIEAFEQLKWSIKRIQGSINILLSEPALELDGFAGPKTRQYIRAFYGLDCTGKTDQQIVRQLRMRKPSSGKGTNDPSQKQSVQDSGRANLYTLNVRRSVAKLPNKGDNLNYNKKEALTIEELNEQIERRDLQCSLNDVCLVKSEKNVHATFSCKDKHGNKVELTISSDASVEVVLESSNGFSSSLSVDREGKVEVTQARKRGM